MKPNTSETSQQNSFSDIIQEASKKHDINPALIEAVIKVESGFNAGAVSHAGAQGLMQLMPETAASLGVSDSFDPQQNINGGARYLKEMMDTFGDVKTALAAYNAGPGAVKEHGGIPPYKETQNYVPRVLEEFNSIDSMA